MRRILMRVLKVLGILVVILLITGFAYEQISRQQVLDTYPPLGELYDVEGRKAHMECRGEGSPTIVLEAGWGTDGTLSWSPIFAALAERSRVCRYDRGGILWSERSERPKDAVRIIEDLHALLAAASQSPPYVLVGHSAGGILIRKNADMYPDEVAGLVFVDPAHPDMDNRLGEDESRPSPLKLRPMIALGIVRFQLRGGIPLPEHLGHTQEAWDTFVAFLPASLVGALDELDAIDQSVEQTIATQIGDSPAIVLTALDPPPTGSGGPTEQAQARHEIWIELNREIAALGTDVDHRMIDAWHYIHHVKPEAVLTAVDDVLRAARTGEPVRKQGAQ